MNQKSISIINEQPDKGDHLPLIDIGTRSLHTVHGSLKNWIISSGWKIDGALRWMWKLLKECPAKREIYEKITSGVVCPVPYFKARWHGNEQVAKRAPSRGFQIDNPIVPFLYFTLKGLLQWLLEKYVLKETLAKSSSERKLLKISPKDFNIWKPANQVDIESMLNFKLQDIKRKQLIRKQNIHFFKRTYVLYATAASHFMENSSIEKSFCSICNMFWPFLQIKESRWIYKRIWIAVGQA